MAEYYLISQLPSLDYISDNAPMPITEERFQELCGRFLRKKALCEIENLTLVPPVKAEKTSSSLVEAWNTGERNLRLALGEVRASKMKKVFDLQSEHLPDELMRVASAAVDIESPLEAEVFLSQYRLSFLETLRPMDAFSDDYLVYYGLKLKLLMRIRQFDTKLGEAAYKSIYNSILLNGNKLEDKQ